MRISIQGTDFCHKKIFVALSLIMKILFWLGLIALAGFVWWGYGSEPELPPEDQEVVLTHFIDSVTDNVKTSVQDYEKLGLASGVDGFALRKAYPGLVPSDFNNVQAYQGNYFEQDGELFYSGNAASNSGVIERVGMRTLLGNISARLGISGTTQVNVDRILAQLKKSL